MPTRSRYRRLLAVALLAVVTLVPALSTITATTAAAAPIIPKTIDEAIAPLTGDPGGPLLFRLDYWLNRPKDNLIAMVGGASKNTGVLQTGSYYAKYRWMTDFDSTSDELVWTVEVSKPTEFNVRFNMSSGPGDEFTLDVVRTDNKLTFGPSNVTSMDLLEPGTITIPAGRHKLRLRKSATRGFNSYFKSIELIRSSDYPAYQQRVKDFRVDMSWMRGKRGYMLQWGGWSYPRWGDRGTMQDTWNDFDVDHFVDEMVKAKVDYVVWSVTWIGYFFPGPIKAIDNIMGSNGDITADRDLLMEIGRGLRAKGIDLAVYYHVGHGGYSGVWWAQQDFPGETFPKNAYGDRSTFFTNWKSVLTEVGNRYRTLIKGFFFDDGLAYYPTDFEELGAVARTGNPDRFISYNPFVAARYTDFQDVNFGEVNCQGKTDFDGRLIDGPSKGLFAHCMRRAHNEWGNYGKNWPTPGFVQPVRRYYQLYSDIPDQGAVSVANMMFNGPTFVDVNDDGTPGDGNLNTGLSRDIEPNYITDIEVDSNGKLYGSTQGKIYDADSFGRWKGVRVPNGDDFGAQRTRQVYILQDGNLMRADGSGNSVNLGNDGFDIATISVGADGSVYGLTADGDLIRWTLGSWSLMPTRMTGLTAVSVGKDYADVWFLDASGNPFHFNGRSVSSYSDATRARFRQLEATDSGDLFAVAKDGTLYEYRRREWTKRSDIGRVLDVAATTLDDFWFIQAENNWIGHYTGDRVTESVRGSLPF